MSQAEQDKGDRHGQTTHSRFGCDLQVAAFGVRVLQAVFVRLIEVQVVGVGVSSNPGSQPGKVSSDVDVRLPDDIASFVRTVGDGPFQPFFQCLHTIDEEDHTDHGSSDTEAQDQFCRCQAHATKQAQADNGCDRQREQATS